MSTKLVALDRPENMPFWWLLLGRPVVWPVRFTETARAKLIDAQDWYEAEAPRFRPALPRKTLRPARAKKSSYALFFLVEPDGLRVVARFYSSRAHCQPLV
jgi:hypothetical protein